MFKTKNKIRKEFWDQNQIGLIDTTLNGEFIKASLTGLSIDKDNIYKLKLLKEFVNDLTKIIEDKKMIKIVNEDKIETREETYILDRDGFSDLCQLCIFFLSHNKKIEGTDKYWQEPVFGFIDEVNDLGVYKLEPYDVEEALDYWENGLKTE